MRRFELAAVRFKAVTWEQLGEHASPTLEALGFTPGSGDVELELIDRAEDGRVIFFDDSELARRTALALAKRLGAPAHVYEVVGTRGNVYRFRTAAWNATATGELKEAEGAELDLEESGGWIGDLADRTHQVLDAYARFEHSPKLSERLRFKRQKRGKPSSPRVAALLESLQKAKSHEAVPQPEGRVELRIELAAGGKQRSFCSATEYDELKNLLGG